MLSVIIPSDGLEQPAVATLAALVPGAAAGVIREVLLVDRSGSGVIERVADVAGCRFLPFAGSRAAALAAGARQARSPWLMVLHAGAVLGAGGSGKTTQFIPRGGAGARQARSPWLMFLHAGAVLDAGWIEETTQFIQRVALGDRPRAGYFRYARSPYAEQSWHDRLRFMARMIAGPSADQGLLIARD